jgi:hypothetical protein
VALERATARRCQATWHWVPEPNCANADHRLVWERQEYERRKEELAKDPDHGGTATAATRREAEVGEGWLRGFLGLE